MAGQSSFPAFIRAEYDGGSPGFPAFERAAGEAFSRVERRAQQFSRSFDEIGKAISAATSRGLTNAGALDLGVGQYRQAAAEARLYAVALRETERTAVALAASTGDTTQQTRTYLAALQAQVVEARGAAAAADAQVATYTRLQTALEATADRNGRLAQSYRELYAEQARAAQQEVRARNFQEGINTVFAPTGSGKSAAASAAVFDEAARGAEQLRAALDPLYAAQQRFDLELARADVLLEQGAISQREYAQAVELARNNLAGANDAIHATGNAQSGLNQVHQNAVKGASAQRFAYVQLGQQLSDVAIQAQLGVNPFVILTQQGSQAAFALSGLGMQADGTQKGIGRLATFLAGPWGAAIFGAITVVGLLGSKLFGTSDAAKNAEKSTYDFSSSLTAQIGLVSNYTAAIDQLEDATRNLINTQALLLDNTKAFAEASAATLKTELTKIDRQIAQRQRVGTIPGPMDLLNRLLGNPVEEDWRVTGLKRKRNETQNLLDSANASLGRARTAVEARTANESADPKLKAQNEIERARADLLQRRQYTLENPMLVAAGTNRLASISEGDFQKQMATLKRREDALNKRKTKTPGWSPSPGDKADNFLDSQINKINDINRAWDSQPRLIDRARGAANDLDDIIADIDRKMKDPNVPKAQREALQATKQAALDTYAVVQDGLNKPYRDLIESQEDQLAVQKLATEGRVAEAEALQLILQKQREGVPIDQARAQAILSNVAAMKELERQQQRIQERQQEYVAALGGIRGGIQSAIGGFRTQGAGSLINIPNALGQAFDQLNSSRIVDRLFGDIFRQMEDKVTGRDKVRTANEAFAGMLDQTTVALERMKGAIDGVAANDNSGSLVRAGSFAATGRALQGLDFGSIMYAAEAEGGYEGPPITVTGKRARYGSDLGLPAPIQFIGNFLHNSFTEFFGQGSPLVKGLDKTVKVFEGTEAGAMIGGGIGATVFGNKASSLFGTLGGALGEKLGKKVGDSIGGLAGVIGGPLGSIAGGLLGGAVGSLFSKTKTGTATIGTNSAGELVVAGFGGNDKDRQQAAGSGADSAISSIDKIAEALGGYVNAGAGSVSIGIRKGSYRVDPTGAGRTKAKGGVVDFGEDAEAAVRYATMDLIRDGIIAGLKASTQRLLVSAKDLDTGLQNALDFESVFHRLKEYKDPVGAALDTLDKEFGHLIKIFKQAGASTEEYAQLEELYGLERAEAIKRASESAAASLKPFLDSLTVGNEALSLRERRGAAVAAYSPLKARVEAGDTTAYDDYAEAAQALLDIQRQISGSTQEYFSLLEQVRATTGAAVSGENVSVLSPSASRPGLFDTSTSAAPVVSAIDYQTTYLAAQNDNLGTIIGQNAQMIELLSGLSRDDYRTAMGGNF